jgi:hypothetical protein
VAELVDALDSGSSTGNSVEVRVLSRAQEVGFEAAMKKQQPTPHRRKPTNDEYQSWDPFTQAKFIYEINRQVGTPITRAEAYKTALQAVFGTAADTGHVPNS